MELSYFLDIYQDEGGKGLDLPVFARHWKDIPDEDEVKLVKHYREFVMESASKNITCILEEGQRLEYLGFVVLEPNEMFEDEIDIIFEQKGTNQYKFHVKVEEPIVVDILLYFDVVDDIIIK